jgi:hypothetical protein
MPERDDEENYMSNKEGEVVIAFNTCMYGQNKIISFSLLHSGNAMDSV